MHLIASDELWCHVDRSADKRGDLFPTAVTAPAAIAATTSDTGSLPMTHVATLRVRWGQW